MRKTKIICTIGPASEQEDVLTPVLSEKFNSVDVMFYHAMQKAKQVFGLSKGDNVILTGGQTNGKSGNTNTIRLETIS